MTSAPLGQLVDIRGGGTPRRDNPAYWNGNIPWATVKDFKTTEISKTLEAISEFGVEDSATSVIPAGNIIVSTRMALGKVAINRIDLAINQDLKALLIHDRKRVDGEYLFRFLLSKSAYIERQGKGATVKGITLDVLRDLEVPLPSLQEQKRIAAILDRADAIRRKRQQAIQLATEFLRSVFLDMFGDPATNPKGWNRGDIRDIVSEVRYGSSVKAGEVGAYPMLRMNNVTYSGGWDFSALKYIDLTESEQDKYLVNSGDLLFNRTNSKELVGKAAVYRESKPMAFAGYLIRVRANGNADNEYIASYLNSEHGKTTLRSICKSIIGMANINAQELQDIPILIPPLDLQQKYARVVQKVILQSKVHHLARDESASLFQALSQRAFSGRL